MFYHSRFYLLCHERLETLFPDSGCLRIADDQTPVNIKKMISWIPNGQIIWERMVNRNQLSYDLLFGEPANTNNYTVGVSEQLSKGSTSM